METSITIRHVPEHVRDEFARRAARTGRSLQAYLLRELTELAERPSNDEWIDRVRNEARHDGLRLTVEGILAARDADRR